MSRILLLFFISILILQPAFGENDSNIVISNANLSYSFDYNKKENTVKIKQEMKTTYQCINFRTSISIAEFYDDKTEIDEVKVYVDGSRAKGIVPRYEYYSIDNIFYSDAHICYFNLPLEKKGSTSEVYFEKTITDPRYFTSIYFTDNYNINNKTISLSIPKWMKVELKEMNFEGRDIKKSVTFNSKDDADIITYTVKDLPAWERENNSPGATYTEPHIMVLCKYADLPEGKITYFNTLDDQYAWYRSLTASPGNNQAMIKTKALEITEGVTGDIAKIKKILYWMHDNIRYIAFEDGIAGYKPEKADVVLHKKYGDCKGMAHLTKELLNALGFDARLCWIGTNHIAYDYSTPSLAVDNHMITALLFQGKTYFLDATESYLGFNEYAERIQGRQVLIENGDKYIYTKVPATSHMQNTDLEKLSLSIKGSNLEGSVTREWKGEEKEFIIRRLNDIRKENTNEAFIKYLSNGQKYSITGLKTSNLDDYDGALTVAYNMQHSNAVSAFGNQLYVDMDTRKDMAEFTFDIKRTRDYWFSFKTNTKMEVELALPADYTLTSFPPNLVISNNDYEFTAGITKLPGKIIYNKSIIIKNARLSKAKFKQWNMDIEKLNAFYNEQIVLTKK